MLMNGLSVQDPDGSRACLIGFHEDSDPSGVKRGVATPAERGGGCKSVLKSSEERQETLIQVHTYTYSYISV